MPVFRVHIAFTNGKHYKGFNIVDGIDLDTYYRHILRHANRSPFRMIIFDVVQISEHTQVAEYMRANKLSRMSPQTPKMKPRTSMGRQRRRF